MAGFLDQYGVGDERRERKRKKVILSVIGLAFFTGLVYFFFHNYRQEHQAKLFFQALAAHNYPQAYSVWAPTEAAKRDYSMEYFMRDWGPPREDIRKFSIIEDEGCENSVIVHVDLGAGGIRKVWVNRDSLRLSFPPDERGCVRALVDQSGNMYFQDRHTRFYQWYRTLKYKMHGLTYR